LARIIQHENDHLDGFLYIDRGDEETKQRIIETFNRRQARKAEKERLKAKKAAKIAAKKG
jgi:peptide deformylase